MNRETIEYIVANDGADGASLLLKKGPEGVDMHVAAAAVAARAKIRRKIPEWYSHPELTYATSLSVEQCSSQATALYKQRFIRQGDVTADITGGLGVDSFFIAEKAASHIYVERQEELCRAARENFQALGRDNIVVINADNEEFISRGGTYSLIYVDPARRGKDSGRIFDLRECEPDITAIRERLLELAERVLVKVSPMADISRCVELLPETRQVHILAVDGECKELLLYLERGCRKGEPSVTAVDMESDGEISSTFTFLPSQEQEAVATFCQSVGRYLYRPSKALLKAGAFCLLSSYFKVEKLAPSTHLYTSDELIEEFPGRCYKTIEVIPFSKAGIKECAAKYPSAGILSHNFPIETASLRKRLGIRDCSSRHIIGTTLRGTKVLLVLEVIPQI